MASVHAKLLADQGSSVTLITTEPLNNKTVLILVVDQQGGDGSGYLNSGSAYVDAKTGDFLMLKTLNTYSPVTMNYNGYKRLTNVSFHSP